MDIRFGSNSGLAYEFETVNRPLVYTSASLKAMFDAHDASGLAAAISYLNSWFADAGVWYGDAISRTSGGKQARRQTEAQEIRDLEKPMVPLATSYLNSLSSQDQASRISSLPGFVAALPGAQVPNASYTTANEPASSGGSLLLPIGAAIAAFLYLKGH